MTNSASPQKPTKGKINPREIGTLFISLAGLAGIGGLLFLLVSGGIGFIQNLLG